MLQLSGLLGKRLAALGLAFLGYYYLAGPSTAHAFETLGIGTEALLGGDLTDPEDDGDPEDDLGYNAIFDANEEPGFGGGEFAFNVFDNILGPGNDKWCCGVGGGIPEDEGLWVQATLDQPHRLTHFTVSSANDVPNRDPTVWSIQGSNDGENFTDIYVYEDGESFWEDRFQVVQFTAGDDFPVQNVGYETFRMVTYDTAANPAGAYFQIGEIEFFGEPGGGGAPASSVADGLVAYWPLDENFEDAAGDFDGEEVGSDPIEFDAGQFGNGIVLNGEDQYVEITGGDEEGLDFIDTEMSVSAWFRVDAFDTNWQALIAKGEQDAWRIHRRGGEAGMAFNAGGPDTPVSDADVDDGEIHHLVAISAEDPDTGNPNGVKSLYIDGELVAEDIGAAINLPNTNNLVRIGDNPSTDNREWEGLIDDVAIWNRALTEDEVAEIWNDGAGASIGSLISGGGSFLMAGDADQDLDFDQLDLVQVQIAGKYLTGAAATWGDGDWDGAPGGAPGSPPAGNGQFDQLDIIAALNGGVYLTGPYAAVQDGGVQGDGQTSITYDPSTGEVGVDAPAGTELTSINIDSASGVFTGEAAANLGGSFDNDADGNIFKATFGGSFGSVSFGNVAQTGLTKEFVLSDLTAVGSLNGGGDLGDVDLIYVPEPSTLVLLLLSVLAVSGVRRRQR